MMTQTRFRYLALSYGADLSRWPAADRDPAEELLANSAEARGIFREQQSIDTVLARAFDAQDAELGAQRAGEDEHAALARLRAGVAGRIAGQPATKIRSRGWRSFAPDRLVVLPVWVTTSGGLAVFRRAGLALGCVCAVTSGLWLGWIQSSGGPGDLLNTLLVIPVSGGG
ncbi:hypothetical protein [Acetobacter sp. DsW_063]|uniref:hypothetical protein n=1 Tax=Acetobacter sp. DsW_063 TaxID=1514894 RepID=UPI000A3AC84E|nr:hypothetical protein [Acetobacter sp. DsW_063]OUJ13686.1 hypothetical protein HK28_01670 [Acetobacter sp. DsW_063]